MAKTYAILNHDAMYGQRSACISHKKSRPGSMPTSQIWPRAECDHDGTFI